MQINKEKKEGKRSFQYSVCRTCKCFCPINSIFCSSSFHLIQTGIQILAWNLKQNNINKKTNGISRFLTIPCDGITFLEQHEIRICTYPSAKTEQHQEEKSTQRQIWSEIGENGPKKSWSLISFAEEYKNTLFFWLPLPPSRLCVSVCNCVPERVCQRVCVQVCLKYTLACGANLHKNTHVIGCEWNNKNPKRGRNKNQKQHHHHRHIKVTLTLRRNTCACTRTLRQSVTNTQPTL